MSGLTEGAVKLAMEFNFAAVAVRCWPQRTRHILRKVIGDIPPVVFDAISLLPYSSGGYGNLMRVPPAGFADRVALAVMLLDRLPAEAQRIVWHLACGVSIDQLAADLGMSRQVISSEQIAALNVLAAILADIDS